MATALLERNGANRPLSHTWIKFLNEMIKRGLWEFNGDTIKIAANGDILDGQHRLWACVESGIPIVAIIVRGLSSTVFPTIDTDRRNRSGGDVVAIAGAGRRRVIIASALVWFIRWELGWLPDYKRPGRRVRNSDIAEAFVAHRLGMERAAERAAKLYRVASPGVLAFLYYAAAVQDQRIADRFLDTLEDPSRASVTDPFFQFRSFLTHVEAVRLDSILVIALGFKALNEAKGGRAVKLLTWRRNGRAPEPFPQLDICP